MKIVPLTWLLHVALDIFQSGMHKLHVLKLKKVASDLQYGAFHSPMTVLCLKLKLKTKRKNTADEMWLFLNLEQLKQTCFFF